MESPLQLWEQALHISGLSSYAHHILVGGLFLLVFAVSSYHQQKRGKDFSSSSSTSPLNTPPQCNFITVKDIGPLFFAKDAPERILKLRNRMGSPDFELPNIKFFPRFFVVTNYQNVRKVLEHESSMKPILPDDMFQNTTHDGMNFISANGERWKHVRKSTSMAFSSQNIKLMVSTISDIVDGWIDSNIDFEEPTLLESGGTSNAACNFEAQTVTQMKSGLEKSEHECHLDILEEMNKITANVIAKVAFDYHLSDSERDAFLKDLRTCWQTFGVTAHQSMLRQFRFTRWMFSDIREAKRAAERMFNFCKKMAEAYRAKKEKKPHKLIHMILNDAEYKDDGERYRDMIAFTIAGFDTTANTLSFTLLELAKNQKEQNKLRDALRACESNNEAHSCPQLKNTVREILRLYPALATGSSRKVHSDIILPSTKKVIPAGSFVISSYYAIQHDPDMFESPNLFLPSRWENATKEQNMSFLTFSFGKRNCLGQALAYAEMYEILTKLCRNYEFGVVNEGEASNVVLYKPEGTILSVKRAL